MDQESNIKALKAMADNYLSYKLVLEALEKDNNLTDEEAEKMKIMFNDFAQRKIDIIIRFITIIL